MYPPGKNVVTSLPAPTSRQPAPYSPPMACRSNNTGLSNPSLTPSICIVSREIVIPFHPLLIAPFGLGNISIISNDNYVYNMSFTGQ